MRTAEFGINSDFGLSSSELVRIAWRRARGSRNGRHQRDADSKRSRLAYPCRRSTVVPNS